MAAPGLSPLANQLADRAFRARMIYTVRIERIINLDAGLDTGTGLLSGTGERTTLYEGIGGIYVKRGRPIPLPDGSLAGSQVIGLIPRGEVKPASDDAFTLLEGPAFAAADLGQVLTVVDVTGGGRLGPFWEFTLTGLEPDSNWDDGS